MPEENVEPSETLRAFRAASLKATEAFNRHDFDSAFAPLPPDIEWHQPASADGARVRPASPTRRASPLRTNQGSSPRR